MCYKHLTVVDLHALNEQAKLLVGLLHLSRVASSRLVPSSAVK